MYFTLYINNKNVLSFTKHNNNTGELTFELRIEFTG